MYRIFEELLEQNGVSSAEVSRATGIAQTTLSNWKKRGGSLNPKNLQLIADYFGVTVDYLLGQDVQKTTTSGQKYYFDDETAAKAQELFENRDLRTLFEAARDASPEDLQMAAELLRRMKKTNPELDPE